VKHFKRIVVADFEYEASNGDLPKLLCYVWNELDSDLQLVRTGRRWRGELGATPPHDIGPDTLYVAYSAWAEMTCFMALGWKFPAHIFDLHTAYLAASNFLLPCTDDEEEVEGVWRKKQGKGLHDACLAYGLHGWEGMDKDTIRKDIGEGQWEKYGADAVMNYCAEDVRMEALLLRTQLQNYYHLRAANVDRQIFWAEYSAKCVAQIQARGMYIDMPTWNAVQENKAAVISELLRQMDPSHGTEYPVFDPDGHFALDRFENWLVNAGVKFWPRTKTGILSTKRDNFRLMSHVPGAEAISALKDSLRVITSAKLPIGCDGRNRPSIFPFGTATGRNAHAKSLFNAHAGMRSFMVAPPGKILVYLDWRTQEVAVAAALSKDQALIDAYTGGDVYHTLALILGFTNDPDPVHWKKQNPDQREQMKRLQLAINYGMGVPSLARGLDSHPLVASTIIERHKRTYKRFWEWRAWAVHDAMQKRRMESVLGWGLNITQSPNERTLYNFPMQSGGADMLRLATMRLCQLGLVPSMLIHDGILLELDNEEQVLLAQEVMRWAGRQVCGGLDVGAGIDKLLKPGERFLDKRATAAKMWSTVERTLESIGVRERRTT
jgi:hypothetical protein